MFELMCDEIPNDLRPYLSAATRQASEGGKPLTVMPDDLREIAEPHMGTTVSEKIDKLLSHVARKTHVPGRSLTIQYRYDYPLVDGLDEGELKDYLDYLVRQGLLRAEATGRGPSETAFKLTIDGWRQLEPALRPGGEPGRCFIASWLDDQMDEPYRKGVEPAVKDCGYRPVWMKDIPENKGITDRIKSEIRRAEFIVADFTGQRPSVYYESGFAQGLGREVIWCCREDELAKLHFDIRHLGHVVWRNPADLREKLADSIRANIIKQG
ncbi:MAG: hypothetical protein KGM47_03860 [Acidobacteriota bacterium]|nr:hypothetical protein [Acidobacteriota bacterium]